jgi:hypothetical protein
MLQVQALSPAPNFSEVLMIHDFDPSGEDHPDDCMCPCCDQPEDDGLSEDFDSGVSE